MSKYSEKIAKSKVGFFRVADLEDYENKELTLTIAFLVEDEIVFNEPKDVLYFSDTGYKLQMNVTNAETLIKLFGDEPSEWTNHQITLYLGTYGKDNKPCIRLKLPNASVAMPGNGSVITSAPVARAEHGLDDEIPF